MKPSQFTASEQDRWDYFAGLALQEYIRRGHNVKEATAAAKKMADACLEVFTTKEKEKTKQK